MTGAEIDPDEREMLTRALAIRQFIKGAAVSEFDDRVYDFIKRRREICAKIKSIHEESRKHTGGNKARAAIERKRKFNVKQLNAIPHDFRKFLIVTLKQHLTPDEIAAMMVPVSAEASVEASAETPAETSVEASA